MSKKTDRTKNAQSGMDSAFNTEPALAEDSETVMIDAVPEITEKIKEAKPIEPKPEPNEVKGAVVPLVVFVQLSGKKPDQIAGFRRFALNQKLGPRTILDWRKKLVEFENRPMR